MFRVFVVLFLGGVAFLATNMILLWNQSSYQQQQQQCPKCECPAGINDNNPVSVRHVIDKSSSEPSQPSIPASNSPQERNNGGNRHDSLLKLLNRTRLRQQEGLEEVGGAHQLAVIVPFRNRYEEMMEFVPHIHGFLERQNVKHKIWIINQADTHR